MAASARATAAAPAYATAFDEAGAGVDLQEIHDFAVDLVLRAGALVRTRARRQAARSRRPSAAAAGAGPSTALPQEKASEIDLVTEVDLAVEDFIRSSIQARYPSHAIVAEESYGAGSSKGYYTSRRGPTWLVDPIDGTLNYTHLLQLHSISIGFSCSHSSIADDALVGCIYAPNLGPLGTLWSGARGRGSYLSYPARVPTSKQPVVDHGCYLADLERRSASASAAVDEDEEDFDALAPQRLPLERKPLPADAPSGILLASEWGKDRRRGRDGKGNLARKLSTMTTLAASDDLTKRAHSPSPSAPSETKVPHLHGVRSLGSSTLDLALCAQGSIDVVWEGGCWEWDVCAGIAILLESGGIVTDSNAPPEKASPYWHETDLPRAELGARRFLVVRACTSTEGETSHQAQQRVAQQIWQRTPGLDYRRLGVIYHVESKSQAKAASSVREIKRLTAEEAAKRRAAAAASSGASEEEEEEASFGGRLLDEGRDRWEHNAWDHVEPPESHRARIQSILATQAETRLSAHEAEPYHAQPASFWDKFYASHENRFFKNRRWLHLEFPELVHASQRGAPPTRILEVGCGAGNTVFPLLEVNENEGLEVFACDYSAEAVDVVKSHPLYADGSRPGHCRASVWDLASASDIDGVAEGSLDVVVLIFVLSALRPSEWAQAAHNVFRFLKPGGLVLFRDYGRHDLPQLRFKKGRMLDENFYIRGDGTRVYFFEPHEVLAIFGATAPPDAQGIPAAAATAAAENVETEKKEDAPPTRSITSIEDTRFETVQMAVDRRMLLNRKEKKEMYRVWLQAKLRRR